MTAHLGETRLQPPVSRTCESEFDQASVYALRRATLDSSYISLGGRRTKSVHEFYRYPARFSPQFARAAIQTFTQRRELVLDPFSGGGTSVVEAQQLGRHAIAADINPIATFVTQAKTTLYSTSALSSLRRIMTKLASVPLGTESGLQDMWRDSGYWRNISDRSTWRIRNLLVNSLRIIDELEIPEAQLLGRCTVLRTGQWALDMRRSIPSVAEFRAQLVHDIETMVEIASHHRSRVIKEWGRPVHPAIIEEGLPDSVQHSILKSRTPPRLILTSPPYPGVYVNYHRWKVNSRRETPAPYWIIGRTAENGMSYYTMSARNRDSSRLYFEKLSEAFEALALVMSSTTWLVQLVGFKDRHSQLNRYLALMKDLGLQELRIPGLATDDDGRLWRDVPSRRWWTSNGVHADTADYVSREVLLVHRKT